RPRLFVNAPLATRFPFEMFDGVGDVDLAARDACILERFVEHRTGRTDKRRTLPIFLVARLLADKHHPSVFGPRTENDLSGGLVEVAPAASGRGRGERPNAVRWRDKRRRRALTAGVGVIRAAGCLLRHAPPLRYRLRTTGFRILTLWPFRTSCTL